VTQIEGPKEPGRDGQDQRQDQGQRHGSFAKSMAAVLWSFFGVRKGRDRERDFAQLNPIHLVIAAVLCTAILIGVLITIVITVTSH
jgi:hypothetical protein